MRRLGDWLDERTGWRSWWTDYLDRRREWAPWSAVMEALVSSSFLALAITGVALMTSYAPSPQTAWASVHHTQYVMAGGRIVRGMHFWAAQALIVLAAAHIVQGALAARYRTPREMGWWITLLVLALVLGEGITGGLLPWDQRGWWARVVEGNIVGLAPVVGSTLRRGMLGGAELGALGLVRAYAAHVVALPIALGVALWGRAALARRGVSGVSGIRTTPQITRTALGAVVGACVIVALIIVAFAAPPPPLDAPADPMSDYPARPEWFLLPLFEIRKFFHGPGEFWGTTLLPGAAGLYLAFLPMLDSPRQPRKIVVAPVLLIFLAAVALSGAAWRKDAKDKEYAKQHAKADARAAAAVKLAFAGVPLGGALEMVQKDPELRGRDLFDAHCASCHVLGDMGDPKKATATKLDGWGTPEWIAAMIHDPDAPEFFGRGPYKGEMPSVDVRPKDKPLNEPWKPMTRTETEKNAVVQFLASQGDEPGDPPRRLDPAVRALGEKVVTDRCTTCHLFKGEGDDEGSGIAPELSGYGSLAWTRAQVANPASKQTYRDEALDEKRKKHMPRFDKDLSAADIDLVVRFTRAHARGLAL